MHLQEVLSRCKLPVTVQLVDVNSQACSVVRSTVRSGLFRAQSCVVVYHDSRIKMV